MFDHGRGGRWLRHVVIVAFNVFYWLPLRARVRGRDLDAATLEVDHDQA